MASVVVVGLGPAGPGQVTARTHELIQAIPHRFVRTRRHPSVGIVGDAVAFDDIYEAADAIEDVYRTIVERLVEAAHSHGRVLYAVPGSPLMAERTVELLRSDGRVDLEIEPALSYLDLAWTALGIDPLAAGV